MKEITLRASAKINLSLDITGVREDGYHLMEMVLQSVGLADTVRIRKAAGEVSLTVEKDGARALGVPQDSSNTAFKAASVFFQKAGLDGGCRIHIEKKIPSQAGMGGGSADAAAVLKGLNELYETGFSPEVLSALGLLVGADVPFCLKGGTALVKGIGEIVEPVSPWRQGHLVIIKPPFGISTADAFRRFDQEGVAVRPDNPGLMKAIRARNLPAMRRAMANVMEQSAGFPEIQALKERFYQLGAVASLMTGSGSAVYGIFASELEALSAMSSLMGEGKAYLTVPVEEGVQVLEIR